MNYFGFNGLLALVKANGGSIESRIRIQKQAYLLKWLGCPAFDDTSFYYHHYGPYSRELSDDLQAAVAAGHLEETPEEFVNGYRRYSYKLTEAAHRSRMRDLESAYEDIVQRLCREKWRTLELAATVLYLEEDESLDETRALARALELKPQCGQYLTEAQALIAYLQPHRRRAHAQA